MHSPRTPARTGAARALLAAALLAASLALTACGEAGSGGNADRTAADSRAGKAAGAGRAGAGPADGKGETADGRNAAGAPRTPTVPEPTPSSHVIRTATLHLRVKDVASALAEARTTAESAGGYVGDETTDRGAKGHERSRVVLRVPQERYESVLDDLAGTGSLLQRKVKAQDVTDQVVDVESRIKSQEASVARVRALMDKASDLADVVTLEGELSSRQAELEALKAQQQSLKDRTTLSTITLVLSETASHEQSAADETGFLDALGGGWRAFVATVRWLAVAVGAVLPFAAALALLYGVWRTVRGGLQRRAPAPESAARPRPERALPEQSHEEPPGRDQPLASD